MGGVAHLIRCAALWAVVVLLPGLSLPVEAEEPTLARLSFWVPPERMAEFAAAYKEQVVPVLKKHGLVQVSEQGRATVDSVFSRLFALETPAEFAEKLETLLADSAAVEVERSLGATFGTTRPDGRIRAFFRLYSTPAGSGKNASAEFETTVTAGKGRGHWRTYDVTDGLPGLAVPSVFQDRAGHLWFGTEGGVSRYDGQAFKNFTTEDGLAGNWVTSILQDRQGHLWFGTATQEIKGGGVSRYDGQSIKTFTTEDGLAHNLVWSIFQDREGDLWIGTWGGVSRYDGQEFSTFNTQNGLAHDWVWSIMQDRAGYLWFGTMGGASRYAGQEFISFTTEDGLADNTVYSIAQDREADLWFGTLGGASRYDGQAF